MMRDQRIHALFMILNSLVIGCGQLPRQGDTPSEGGENETQGPSSSSDSEGSGGGGGDDSGTNGATTQHAELWYSSGQSLVRIALSIEDGSFVGLTESPIAGLSDGYSGISMLKDGSLIISRLDTTNNITHFYHIPNPPKDGSPAQYDDLGTVPDGVAIEGLYVDCDGRLYGMDTGRDTGSAVGNRLLLFTGDYLQGDFSFHAVSDLSTAIVADIDDMGPGIDEHGHISDNPGLAIDSSDIYDFDYETGTGTRVAKGGSWGIHALGGDLFDDGVARVYLLSADAQLFELDPNTYELSGVLATGPETTGRFRAWSGLAGPLSYCETGFEPPM